MESRIQWKNNFPSFYLCSGEEEDISLDMEFQTLFHGNDSAKSLLRAAKYEREKTHSEFLKFPIGLSLEAQSFGAKVIMDQRGIRIKEYPYHSIQNFLDHYEQRYCSFLIDEVIACIVMADNVPVILKLSGAFSLLASLIDPMTLYRDMRKNSEILHKALKILNHWLVEYATKALQKGVTLISFADTMAFSGLMGKGRYLEFAGNYQRELFQSLAPLLNNAMFHICGKNSVDLIDCSLMGYERLTCKELTYGKELLTRSKEADFQFCGLGCMAEEGVKSQWIWKLILN